MIISEFRRVANRSVGWAIASKSADGHLSQPSLAVESSGGLGTIPLIQDAIAIDGRDEMLPCSIAKMMAIVGVVALNLAAARLLLSHSLYLLIGASLIGLSLQVGSFRLVRSRNRVRMFWVGFVAFGSLAMLSFLWGTIFAPITRVAAPRSRMHYAPIPGSPMWTLWHAYFGFAVQFLGFLPYSSQILGIGGEMPVITVAAITFLPQLLIAAAGGLLTRLVVRWWHKTSDGALQLPGSNLP
jgi:hypothetical protein